MEKFLIIDGSSLIHKAFFALPPLVNKQGLHTGAVYGLCNMLLKLLENVHPQYMAVAFDKSRKTFRSRLYPEYKAQRAATPSELSQQFPLAIKVLEALHIKCLELDDYEADDILGTFSVKAPEGVEVIIVTGDRDALQLISERTKVYYSKRGSSDLQIFDKAEFAANYEGLEPKQLIDLKGLMGDSSDNIPGVPGVGPKTAMKLIKAYGSVENTLANIEEVTPKGTKAKLEANKEIALLSKELATINLEAPVDCNLANYLLAPVDEKAQNLLQELEFKNMYQRFAELLGCAGECFSLFGDFEAEQLPITVLGSEEEAKRLFDALGSASEPVAFFASCHNNRLEAGEIYWQDQLYTINEASEGWPLFLQWLGNGTALKVTHDCKELYKAGLWQGFTVAGIVGDVALASYVVDPGRAYDLQALEQRYINKPASGPSQAIALVNKELTQLMAEQQVMDLYSNLELPLVPVLAKMEVAGIKPDMELLEQLREDMVHRIKNLEELAQKQAGEPINLKSPKQLGILLFEKLGLPVIKKTKTGYSTDVKVLEELEGKHPLITTILEHRKLAKLQSTYLDGLKPLVNPVTGRIHTHFQQMVTVTGRLSSTDPNLQNIPTRTEEGKQIRAIFVPGEGYDYLMSCDYSQVELRILACIAQDKLLLEAFREGQDIHARTAAEVFGVPLDQVTSEMRSKAKAVNFGIVYGISDFGLAVQLKVTRAEAAGYIKSYFARYTGVKDYMDKMVAQAKAQGYVSTLMGRRRYLPDINHSNFNLRSFAERTAINTPIQGTAADIMKYAMLKVQEELEKAGLRSRILLQVHDELVLEVPEEEKDQAAALVQKTMMAAAELEIPLLAEVSFGTNWAKAK